MAFIEVGYKRATMGDTKGRDPVKVSQSLKSLVVRIGVCNSTP